MTLFLYLLVTPSVFFGCDGVANSSLTWDACGVCDGDNSSCTDCHGNIVPGFVNNGTCGMFTI